MRGSFIEHDGSALAELGVDGVGVGDEPDIGGVETHIHPPTVASDHAGAQRPRVAVGGCGRTRPVRGLWVIWQRAAEVPGPLGSGPGGPRTPVTVTRVVDGDTIQVELDGRDTTIRIIGIDTPEMDGPYTQEECFGREASAYAEQALAGAEVELEFDVDRADRFGRTLA